MIIIIIMIIIMIIIITGVPYEKGFCTLTYLENKVGTPEFEEFAKAYGM
jgi:hypothetical protein